MDLVQRIYEGMDLRRQFGFGLHEVSSHHSTLYGIAILIHYLVTVPTPVGPRSHDIPAV